MDYGMISRIEKAKLYADQRDDRIDFMSFAATVKGENHTHTVTFENDTWTCTCEFFGTRGVCSHTIALERVLKGMIPGPGETRPGSPNGG